MMVATISRTCEKCGQDVVHECNEKIEYVYEKFRIEKTLWHRFWMKATQDEKRSQSAVVEQLIRQYLE